mgnify:CR=1 FL=1
MDASEVKLRQSLWYGSWDGSTTGTRRSGRCRKPDPSRIGAMDPAADKQAAIDNNYTLKYNRLSYEQLTDGSVEQQNMARTIEDQTAAISSSLKTCITSAPEEK